MTKALFLGNSHLSAFKLAYDEKKGGMPECVFFCARGADLCFTEVVSGRIRPVEEAQLSEEDIRYFFPEASRRMIERYTLEKRAWTTDVRQQFVQTGGCEEIDLSDIGAVFYVAGVSPYDFYRLGEGVVPTTRQVREIVLERILGEGFVLRKQIKAIRACQPRCRHFLIGSPLVAWNQPALSPLEKLIVSRNRTIISLMAKDYLFDDVYMPDEEVLDESLLVTKAEFCRSGVKESLLFQAETVNMETDNMHMNRSYAEVVFRDFIEERLLTLTTKDSPLNGTSATVFPLMSDS